MNCESGDECEAPIYTTPIKPEPLPEQGGGGGVGIDSRLVNLDDDINPKAPFIVRGRQRPMDNPEPVLELVAKYGADLNGMLYICTEDGSVWNCMVSEEESGFTPSWEELTQ